MSLQRNADGDTIAVDVADAPVWVDVLFVFSMLLIHLIYGIKFTIFSFNFLHAKCDQFATQKMCSVTRLFLRSISADKENFELEKYANHGTNFSKLWRQSFVLRYTLRISICVSLCISLILWLCVLVNLFFEFVISCTKDGDARILGLLFVPVFVFISSVFVRFILHSMSTAWSTIMDEVGDKMADEQRGIEKKRRALSDASDLNDMSLPTQLTPKHGRHSSFVASEHQSKLKRFTSPYFVAVHWRLCWIACCIIATMLAVARTQTEFDVSDSFFLKLFVRYMMIAAMEWNIVYFVCAVSVSIYGHVVNLDIFDAESASKRQSRKKKIAQSRFCRCFCLKGAFGIAEDQKSPWMKCRVRLNLFLIQFGLVLIVAGLITGSGLTRFLGILCIIYYFCTILLVCKTSGIYYLWKFDADALELRADDETVLAHRQRAATRRSQMDEAMRAIARAATMGHLSQQLNVKYDEDDHKLEEIQMEVLNDAQPQELQVAVSNSTDTVDQTMKESEDQNDENDFQFPSPLSSQTTLNPNATDDNLQIYLRLYLKLYNKRQRVLNKWETASNGGWLKKHCRVEALLLAISYISALFSYYRLYWLLILPYNFNIRPYSMCFGGDSMIEDCWKFQNKPKPAKQKAKDFALYCWGHVNGLLVCLIMFIVLLVMFYGVTAFSNAVSPVEKWDPSESGVQSNSSEIYPICETRYGILSVLDLGFFVKYVYEMRKIEEEYSDIINMQDTVSMYFDSVRAPNEPITDSNRPTWQIKHYSLHDPSFFHVRNEETASDLIAVRGTKTQWDAIQSLALFGSVGLLQMFSMVIPITSLTPTSFVIRFVYFASFFEGIVDDSIRDRWDEPVYEYAYNLVSNYVENGTQIDSLYIVGHSLGGGISQAVAAKLWYMNKYYWTQDIEIKSYSLSAPGMTYGSRKFEFDLESLFMTSIVVYSDDDVVSKIDKQGGMSQIVECREKTFAKCHPATVTNCELFNHCNRDLSKNKQLYAQMCVDPNSVNWRDLVINDLTNTTINI